MAMNTAAESYRQIVRSSLIIGGSTIINILIGLLRTKAVALLLGPAGVGLIGLLQNLMNVAANVAALGLRTAGTRQIAKAVGRNDVHAIAATRLALFWGTITLALVGAAGIWLLRNLLAAQVLADPGRATQVGWLAFGVAMSVAASSQSALLTGLRRIGDLARISLASSILATIAGVAAVLISPDYGLVVFVLATPVSSFILGLWVVRRLGRLETPSISLVVVFAQLGKMLQLGAAFMIAGVATLLGELAVRTLISRGPGAGALGEFQASWTISVTYTGLVLGAMGADYYPRLASAIHDADAANRLVNEQTEVALLLAGPMFIGVIGIAPWIIEALYSKDFHEAAAILQWQALGDILKIASWPLGYFILAFANARMYLLSEITANAVFVAVAWFALPRMGIEATGVSFLLMYALYLPFAFWISFRRSGFVWTRRVTVHFTALVVTAIVVFLTAGWSQKGGAIIGSVAALIAALHAIGRLRQFIDPGTRAGRIVVDISSRVNRVLKLSHE